MFATALLSFLVGFVQMLELNQVLQNDEDNLFKSVFFFLLWLLVLENNCFSLYLLLLLYPYLTK